MRLHILSAVAVAIVAVAAQSSGQAPDSSRKSTTRVLGVYDSRTGQPLQGVLVRDVFSGTYAATTETGTVALSFVTFRGTGGLLELQRLGYQEKQIVLTQGESAPITEILDEAVALAPVVTEAKYRLDRDAGTWGGFEQRCQSTLLTCIRVDDLIRKPSANLADFLIRQPSVVIGTCALTGGASSRKRAAQCGLIAMRSDMGFCRPTFYVDGFEWPPPAGVPIDLVPGTPAVAPYTPTNVKGIEVYPPGQPRPARFIAGTCGVVAIWTK